ncbi:OTUBL thioesterase, partial [Spelaeornis formosus]|nr:OTUBL thioesterase [Elachura formosa]
KEADHAQIMALAEALSVGVRVAYLDRSELNTAKGDVINWVEFGRDTTEQSAPLTLLYRPGHFDVVTK